MNVNKTNSNANPSFGAKVKIIGDITDFGVEIANDILKAIPELKKMDNDTLHITVGKNIATNELYLGYKKMFPYELNTEPETLFGKLYKVIVEHFNTVSSKDEKYLPLNNVKPIDIKQEVVNLLFDGKMLLGREIHKTKQEKSKIMQELAKLQREKQISLD